MISDGEQCSSPLEKVLIKEMKVRVRIFLDYRLVPVYVGQSIQILPPQTSVPHRHRCLRTWELDMR